MPITRATGSARPAASVFPALHREAGDWVTGRTDSEWDPFAFIRFCEHPRSPKDRIWPSVVQLAEWQLLFDYCTADRLRSRVAAR